MAQERMADMAGDLADQTDLDLLEALESLGEDEGYYEPLGKRHAALFSDEGPVLLVTFETLASIRARPGHRPLGHQIAKAKGWSSLCLIACEDSWYRDRAVYRFFDRQVDDAFFEDFDRVVFWGAGMGGYAAAAYAVTAPGATVILAAPQATLDPRVTGWDERFRARRRLSFTDRYGYAPEMIEGAGPVHVIYDPQHLPDAMHASLFTRGFVTMLPCPWIGPDPAAELEEMELLAPLLTAACEGRFTPALFWQAYRARRQHAPYIRRLGEVLEARGRLWLNALLHRAAGRTLKSRRFRRRGEALEAELAETGRRLPEPV